MEKILSIFQNLVWDINNVKGELKYNSGDELNSRVCDKNCLKCPIYQNATFFLSECVECRAGFLCKPGGKVKLSYSAARALCLLQRNMDEFVKMNEILKYVWGDNARVNNNVNVAIYELRTALTGTDFHILNQRKVGYMLTEAGM